MSSLRPVCSSNVPVRSDRWRTGDNGVLIPSFIVQHCSVQADSLQQLQVKRPMCLKGKTRTSYANLSGLANLLNTNMKLAREAKLWILREGKKKGGQRDILMYCCIQVTLCGRAWTVLKEQTKFTSTRGNAHRGWPGFQAVPVVNTLRPFIHVAKSIWCSRSGPSTSLAGQRMCQAWVKRTHLPPPKPQGDVERMEAARSGVLLAGWILFVRVGKQKSSFALPSRFNHLLLPRCTAGPACDWLGPRPASIQFVA